MLTILAIDPSSTASGYAVLRGGKLVEAGVVRPRRSADANARIRRMAVELAALGDEYRPDVAVIEDTSGKVGRRHGGGGAGLAVYGKAVGYLLADAERWVVSANPAGRVVMVLENVWTRGVPKAVRLRRAALLHSGYDPAADPGGDAGDAILLAEWYAGDSAYREAVENVLAK